MNAIQRLYQRIREAFAEIEDLDTQDRAMSAGRLRGQIWDQLDEMSMDGGVWHWLVDVYFEDGGAAFAIIAREGKLFRADVTISGDDAILGEFVQVMEAFVPVTQSLIVHRQADGRDRWMAIASSAVLNRNGEIDSRDLFDSFVAHATESGEYPYLQFYHQGESLKMGSVDYLARDGDLYINSGLFDDTPLGRAAAAGIQSDPDYWGISIGFLPTDTPELIEVARDVTIPVYRKGIHLESSILAESTACALMTTIGHVKEQRMDKRIKDDLVKLVGADLAADFEEIADQRQRTIQDEGLITRQTDEPAAEPTETPEVELDEETAQALVATAAEGVLASEAFQALQAAVAGLTTQVQDLTRQIGEQGAARVKAEKGLTERLSALEKTDDQKRETWQSDMPRRNKIAVSYRPSQPQPEDGAKPSMADTANKTLAIFPE